MPFPDGEPGTAEGLCLAHLESRRELADVGPREGKGDGDRAVHYRDYMQE